MKKKQGFNLMIKRFGELKKKSYKKNRMKINVINLDMFV